MKPETVFMLFAAIYVPDFAVEALVRAEPELREQALAVVEGTPPLLTVAGVNERARQCGVEPGMTALQAEERLRCAPPAQVRRRSAAQEHAAHAALLDCACAFSPRVEDTAADTILLDMAGLDRLFGPPATMACELAQRAAQTGMQVNVAVAGNPDAAMHTARGFPGVTVIPAGQEAERLGGLPVDLLFENFKSNHGFTRIHTDQTEEERQRRRDAEKSVSRVAFHVSRGTGQRETPARDKAKIGNPPQRSRDTEKSVSRFAFQVSSGRKPEAAVPDQSRIETALEALATLDRWGVRTLGALAALPEVALAQRLGQAGVHWQRLARGATSRPLRVVEPPLTFGEAVELEYPVALLEPLAFMLNRMLEQLCFRLGSRALAAQELRVRLQLDIAEDPENLPQRHRDTEESVSSFAFQVSRSTGQRETPVRDKPNIENQAPQRRRDTEESVSSFAFQVSSGHGRETGNVKRETVFERSIRLPVPMLDARVFLKLLQLDLQAHPPGAPVVKIWLEAEPAEPRRAQGGLFVPLTPEPEKLELTLARINSVVSRRSPVASETQAEPENRTAGCEQAGDDLRVGSPEVLDTHRPDAFRMRKFNPCVEPETQSASTRAPKAGALAQHDKRLGVVPNTDEQRYANETPTFANTGQMWGTAEESSASAGQMWGTARTAGGDQSPIANRQTPMARMAMRMLRPPPAVKVELRDGVPRRIRATENGKGEMSRAVCGEIVWAAGPWRSSGEWWTEECWAREEWDVALKDEDEVALYRIYRDGTGKWFVEGEYD